MIRIVLVRHGEVPGIVPAHFRGRADLELTERGRAQARATADWIARHWQPGAIYTSPLQRCVQTGRAIADACGKAARLLNDLNDIDYGQWQGKSFDDMRESAPDEFQRWQQAPHLVRFPGGESLQDLAARAADALRYVMGQHDDDTVVLVGHDSSNRALLLHVLGMPLSAYWRITQDPCGISEILVSGLQIQVLRVNETAHLSLLASE